MNASMCEVRTHVADSQRQACSLCGTPIPALSLPLDPGKRPPIQPGERIGIIRTRSLGARSYRVGNKDSNLGCLEEEIP